jgi:hypothetical protein
MLNITDMNNSFYLDERSAINLELKLNVTKHGHEWRPIGDVLYKYGTSASDAVNNIVVTEMQYKFLEFLQGKVGWQSCRDLSISDM